MLKLDEYLKGLDAVITQKQIAELAGVSFATVSRAMTHSAKVHPKTMMRIRNAMNELGISNYEELFLGRNTLSKMVLVVVGDIVSEFFANIIVGIDQDLSTHGYSIVLCNSHYNCQIELERMKRAEEDGYAGIVMITATETPELVEFLQKISIPTVLVNRYIRSLDMDVVRIDNYRGGYMAAQHFIEHNHKRIAHLAGPRNSAAPQDRLRGFRDGLHDSAIQFEDEDVVYGNLSRSSGVEFADWLATKDYTAAYIGNNYMAVGVVNQLKKYGIEVPRDFSLLCFDDSPLVNENGLNLTTISSNPQEMGIEASKILMNRISDPLGQRKKIIFSPQINIRGSVRKLQ